MRLGLGPGNGDGEEKMDWRDQTDENEGTMEAISLGVYKVFTTLAPVLRTVPGTR